MSKELAKFTVQVTDSIRTAMEKITANRHRAVVVLDGIVVVGTVSDGDIRRAFLHDVLAVAPVEKIMNVNFRSTTETDPVRQHQILVREKDVTVMPIVNDHNELVDVVLRDGPLDDSQKGGS